MRTVRHFSCPTRHYWRLDSLKLPNLHRALARTESKRSDTTLFCPATHQRPANYQRSSPMSTMSTEVESLNYGIFIEVKDRYDCLVLDLANPNHACSEEIFRNRLQASIESWRTDGVRAVTISIPSNLSHRIPCMVELGFDFHHAKPGYVLMLKWLSDVDTNNFPGYANHYVGVGGFVVNDEGKVLAIKERFWGDDPPWKLPGGGADAGEDLAVTAKREVFEETGVRCEFVGVLAYRHLHGFRYGNSDFYCASLMRATSTEIKADRQEILEAKWLTIEEYGARLHHLNKFILQSYLDYKKTGIIMKENKVLDYRGKNHYSVYKADRTSDSDDPAPGSQL